MSKTGEFFADLEETFGKGRVTSGFRSQEEQDALVAAGKTRAKRSSHTYERGYDLAINSAANEDEIRAKLAQRGLTAVKIIKESGKGRNQGTGPHWHIELGADGKPAVSAPTPRAAGTGIIDPASLLDGLQSALAPEAMASGGVTSEVTSTFGSDQEFRTRAGAVEGALQQQGDAIDILTQVTDAAQATQLATLAETVDETKAISDELTRGNEQLRRQVQPVFQARGRIADQLDKLNTMNPLERGLRSIFDLNYDRGFLKKQLSNYDTTLEMRANDFDYMSKLHERAIGEIDRRYGLANALPGLAVEQTKEDMGIIGMRIQQTAGMLGSLRDRVSGESQLISAKAMAREDMLSRLDGPTVMSLAQTAKGANGVVSHNGVQFSYGELRDRLEREEEQELSREAYRMSIASGRMDMADKYAMNIARSLTRPQAEAALANGGVHNGIALPQDILNNVYKSHLESAALQAGQIEANLPAAIALRVASDSLNQIAEVQTRTRTMFGGAGIKGAETYLQNGTDLVRQLIKATEEGAPPEVITTLTQKIASNSQTMMGALDESLLRQAGGDKVSAGHLKSFVLGVPMDSASSVQAITHFAVKGTRPDGVAMTPEATQVFQFAEKTVRKIIDENPKISQNALAQQVAIAVGDYSAKTVGQARLERISSSLPALAKRANSPFGKMPESAWNRARSNAAASAYAGVANQLEIPVEQVRKMRTTGKPLDTTPEGQALFEKFVGMSGNFNALEHQALIREVDELPALQPGTRNSDHMIEFMGSSDLMKQTDAYESGTGSASFGDYLINPVSVGAVGNMITQESSGLRAAQSDLTQADRQAGRVAAAAFRDNPVARTQTILATIPGVGKMGAQKLLPGIQQYIAQNDADFWEGATDRRTGVSDPNAIPFLGNDPKVGYDGPAMQFANTRMVREDQMILNYLESTKFDDASAEAYRKAALKGWKDSRTQANTLFENLIDAITPRGF